MTDAPKHAPVQGFVQGIPWEMHLRAYDAYCKKHSPQPALIEGWCRGGFGVEELDGFIPGWRDELSHLKNLENDHRDLMRAAYALCLFVGSLDTSAIKWAKWKDLWKLCKDHKEDKK